MDIRCVLHLSSNLILLQASLLCRTTARRKLLMLIRTADDALGGSSCSGATWSIYVRCARCGPCPLCTFSRQNRRTPSSSIQRVIARLEDLSTSYLRAVAGHEEGLAGTWGEVHHAPGVLQDAIGEHRSMHVASEYLCVRRRA